MPSALPLPTIGELLKAFDDAVIGQKEPRANVRRGSCYDHFAGIGAILFSREAQRDRDLFRAVYFDTSDGDDLTEIGTKRYGAQRVLDTAGTGSATLTRAALTAGAGVVYQGTRITVVALTGMADPKSYVVAVDTPMTATQLSVAVPIRAAVSGPGSAVNAVAPGSSLLRIDDALWDASLTVQAVVCGNGAAFETAKVYRARIRQGRLDARKGYKTAIFSALAILGATNVVAFPSNYTGDANDNGLNYIYVGDAGYNASSALVTSCSLAVDASVVFGTAVQVLPMASSALTVQVTVSLWDDPGAFNLTAVAYDLQMALVNYFDGRSNAFTYRLDAMAGAMQSASASVQSVAFTSPTVDQTITTGSPPQLPAVLTRFTLAPANVLLTFQGPT